MGRKAKQRRHAEQLQLAATNKDSNQQPKAESVNNNTRTVSQIKEVPGFMSLRLEHTVTKTDAKNIEFHFKINPTVWHEVLAFFKWTYDTTKSESQVRLFVNPTTREWAAWAFPQLANTGMTAKELENHERFAEERAQFDGWVYFGTVHHHCSASAFQSGVDEANEKAIDGLHITVGNMDKDHYSLDCRLYLGGIKFIPNMDWLWDVGDYKAQVPVLPSWAKVEVPSPSMMALWQMGRPAPADTTFPQEWADNLIVPPRPVVVVDDSYKGGLGYGPTVYNDFRRLYLDRSQPGSDWDRKKGFRMLMSWIQKLNGDPTKPTIKEVIQRLKNIAAMVDDHDLELIDICCQSDNLPEKFAEHLEKEWAEIQKMASGEPEQRGVKALPPVTPREDEAGTCPDCGMPPGHHAMHCELIHNGMGS